MATNSGTTAIEVATMLGDSVVGVTYVGAPRDARARNITYALAAAGVLGVVIAIAALAHALSIATINHDDLARWVGVAHRPAFAFRPQMIGLGTEIAAFGGFAAGLAALTTALARARAARRSPSYLIGTGPTVDAPTLGAPSECFPLVASAGDRLVFNYGAGIDGELVADGITTPLTALTASGQARPSLTTVGAIEMPIPAHGKIRAHVGQTTFWITAVPAPRAPVGGPRFDNRLAGYFGASLAVHLAVWAILQQTPLEGSSANLELTTTDGIMTRTSNTEPEDAVEPPDPATAEAGASASLSGASMKLPSGTIGGDKTPTGTPAPGTGEHNTMGAQLTREQAVANARESFASDSMRTAIAALTINDPSELDGFEGNRVYDGLTDDIGGGGGSFGHGLHGNGAGGGGAGGIGFGTIDNGGYGRLGRCTTHCGESYSVGGGLPGEGGRHKPLVPTVTLNAPQAIGGLDKAIIRRYIKRNLDKITYCYEKQLLARPTLDGTLRVDFFISPTGSVTSATGSGFDPQVSSCVTDVVRAIDFPRPSDGGGVNVSYPFVFRAAAGATTASL